MGLFSRNSQEQSLRHLLTVNDKRGVQTFALDASMYSIGRDQTNAIVVQSDAVSRQHAILLRTPNPDRTYSYIIQDGNLEGKPSAHGTLVNGLATKKRTLKDGDEILLGGKVTLIYRSLLLSDAELEEKVTIPTYRKLKGNPLSLDKTVQVELSDDITHPLTPPQPPTPPAVKAEIAHFRECYQSVAEELADLKLNPAQQMEIALAIYQKLSRQTDQKHPRSDTVPQRI